MRTAMLVVSVSLLLTVSAFAADAVLQPKGPGPDFEQNKAEIIKRIDLRIARNQEEKACVQAAANHDDIKACRDKFRAGSREQHRPMRK